MEFAMTFPTVVDCARLRGAERELLHELDQLLRDVLVATQYKARELDLLADGVETACVTVMMSVAAGAALAAADSPSDVTEAIFTAAASDALASARQQPCNVAVRQH
jgi:hypothetical protein